MRDRVDTTHIRNVYREGFDFTKIVPLSIERGRFLVKAVLPSDFDQLVGTDHLDEVKFCKLWQIVSMDRVKSNVEPGDFVIIVKAAIDGIDTDAPRYGIVDAQDIACKVQAKKDRPQVKIN